METFTTEMQNLLIKRLEDARKRGQLMTINTLGRQYTPDEIIDEAKRGTPAGEEFLMAEKRFMDFLKSKMPL